MKVFANHVLDFQEIISRSPILYETVGKRGKKGLNSVYLPTLNQGKLKHHDSCKLGLDIKQFDKYVISTMRRNRKKVSTWS